MRHLKNGSAWLYQWARPGRVASLLTGVAVFFWMFNFSSLPFSVAALRAQAGGALMLDVRIGYSSADAHAFLTALGPSGRAAYLNFLALDGVFLLAYGFGFSALLSRLLRTNGWHRGRWSDTNLLPVGVALADALENLGTLTQLFAYPQPVPAAAMLGSLFTSIKQVGAGVSLLLLLILGLRAGLRMRDQ